MHSLRATRQLIDIRNLETVTGIELEPGPCALRRRAYETPIDCVGWWATMPVVTSDNTIALGQPQVIEQPCGDTIVERIATR